MRVTGLNLTTLVPCIVNKIAIALVGLFDIVLTDKLYA